MKKYEYKLVRLKRKIGFDYDEKIIEIENKFNELGNQGFKLFKITNDIALFIKEID